jgi:hypothetical protein
MAPRVWQPLVRIVLQPGGERLLASAAAPAAPALRLPCLPPALAVLAAQGQRGTPIAGHGRTLTRCSRAASAD